MKRTPILRVPTMLYQKPQCLFLAGALCAPAPTYESLFAEPIKVTVQTDQPGRPINTAMWGIFFEDINLGADGGLYAELVKNRSFEFPEPIMGWSKMVPAQADATFEIKEQDPFNPTNPHYLRVKSGGAAPVAIANEGFRGIRIRSGETYDFSARVRAVEGTPSLEIQLVAADGKSIASSRVENVASQWKERSATLRAASTEGKARLSIMVHGKGTVDLDMVSVFPQKTWKNRPGGLRADMAQLLADMKPGFMRFPGGCIVEGSQLDRRYQWKNTIGPVAERKLLINRWNYELKHRPAPDYFQSFGLGFFEFFQLCDDVGAQPLPIINCGMACQFNSGELLALDALDPFIQDALDLIEFANGPTTSLWAPNAPPWATLNRSG